MKLFSKESDSRKRMMLLFLIAAGIMEFLFITLENLFYGFGYYLTETYLIIPALLFAGCALGGKLSKFAGKRLLLAGIAVAWFVLVQFVHKLSGMDTQPLATFFFIYLMAFPFASVSEDHSNAGINWIGGMFLTASLILVGYAGILLLELVPDALTQYLYWDGARMRVFWHPNVSACFFMLGIAFSAAFLVQSRKIVVKVLLAVAIVLQFASMALTNCRTTLLLTSALFGGILFFKIFKGNWKQLILGLLAALIVFVGAFKISGSIYQWHNERLIDKKYEEMLAAAESEEIPAETETVQEETLAAPEENVPTEQPAVINKEDIVLVSANSQKSLAHDLRTFNSRTGIWKSALNAVKDSKILALFGTEYAGLVLSSYYGGELHHAHNSWLEVLMRLGIPGLLMSLVFTALAVWSAVKLVFNQSVELWKKIVAMLTVCLLGAGFLEPYLFITNVYYHVTDFAFFFLTGYLDYWANAKTKE